jgi:hypothetical protein
MRHFRVVPNTASTILWLVSLDQWNGTFGEKRCILIGKFMPEGAAQLEALTARIYGKRG